jgi:hypothetical protein
LKESREAELAALVAPRCAAICGTGLRELQGLESNRNRNRKSSKNNVHAKARSSPRRTRVFSARQ